jgi:coatomer subunit beta
MATNSVLERSCSMLVYFDRAASANEIKEALETGDNAEKAEALRKAISMLMNGETLPAIFITMWGATRNRAPSTPSCVCVE